MNTLIVKFVPQGDFEVVSDKTHDESSFLSLISRRKGVSYQVFEWPNLSRETQSELSRQRYLDLILESDTNQHFLVPKRALEAAEGEHQS